MYSKASFETLQDQVSQLATSYFKEPPSSKLPTDVLRSIPSNLSLIFSQTASSQALRTAYIQHLITSILTRRIFAPYLFVLKTNDNASDSAALQAFCRVAATIRSKSTMKESCWRQQTLYAIYSSPGAKVAINTVATEIVEDIEHAVIPFLASKKWDRSVRERVRKIVKCAVEVWRYASMEPGKVQASMEPGKMVGEKEKKGKKGIVLVTFPKIWREAVHEDLRGEENRDDNGCVYLQGSMIRWSDDTLKGDRAEEKTLKASTTTTFPNVSQREVPMRGNEQPPQKEPTTDTNQRRASSPLIPNAAIFNQRSPAYSKSVEEEEEQAEEEGEEGGSSFSGSSYTQRPLNTEDDEERSHRSESTHSGLLEGSSVAGDHNHTVDGVIHESGGLSSKSLQRNGSAKSQQDEHKKTDEADGKWK